jgi:hypothetical protein
MSSRNIQDVHPIDTFYKELLYFTFRTQPGKFYSFISPDIW